MLNDQERLLSRHLPDQFDDLLCLFRGKSRTRLIEEHEFRVLSDGQTDFQSPLLAVAKRACRLVPEAGKVNAIQYVLGLSPYTVHACQSPGKLQATTACGNNGVPHILVDRHLLKDVNDLEGPGDPEPIYLIRRMTVDSLFLEVDNPFCKRIPPRNQVEERALTGTIGPNEGVSFPFEDFQVHIINDNKPTEIFRNTL